MIIVDKSSTLPITRRSRHSVNCRNDVKVSLTVCLQFIRVPHGADADELDSPKYSTKSVAVHHPVRVQVQSKNNGIELIDYVTVLRPEMLFTRVF